jgi:hypothetical protein
MVPDGQQSNKPLMTKRMDAEATSLPRREPLSATGRLQSLSSLPQADSTGAVANVRLPARSQGLQEAPNSRSMVELPQSRRADVANRC